MKPENQINEIIKAPPQQKFAIVVAEFNKPFTEEMLNIAQSSFKRCEATVEKVVWVPGAFELPFASQKLFDEGIDVVLVLAVVIRGETSHYEHVCNSSARGVMQVSLENKKPVIFGVLTCENEDQVRARIPRTHDLAVSAIKMGLIMNNDQ
ncbi:6,7-dimethyl-8-ribityllumazine synthase [Candidatus Peregrinibacteria bacterium]|jgi:6,7-dimethyl-8-ribityllumazine synthase|nr:6,7-dimethyl-8-ribityllumazine synthase [Candidatus Peregrinibacteria bacterium]